MNDCMPGLPDSLFQERASLAPAEDIAPVIVLRVEGPDGAVGVIVPTTVAEIGPAVIMMLKRYPEVRIECAICSGGREPSNLPPPECPNCGRTPSP